MQLQTKSMYQIRGEHLGLLKEIEESDGELTPEMEQALKLTADEFESKAISYGFVVKSFEDVEEMLDKEIKRLTALKQKAAKRAEKFKDTLDKAMKEFGFEKIQTETLTLSYRKSKPVELVEGFEENLLSQVTVEIKPKEGAPEGIEKLIEYFDVKAAPSKTRIGDALKAGATIDGAKIVEKKNLQIK
jgi:translation initiation factor 2B subunit (eIF-2B alpha/beta/delta family)